MKYNFAYFFITLLITTLLGCFDTTTNTIVQESDSSELSSLEEASSPTYNSSSIGPIESSQDSIPTESSSLENSISSTTLTSSSSLSSEDTGSDNALAPCTNCHNDESKMLNKQLEYATSGHATGANTDYAGGRTSCTGCHSHQGFLTALEAGVATTATLDAAPINPVPTNCQTCHNIHDVYDSTDWGLRVPPTDSVLIAITNTQHSFGKGNVCASCHQSRGTLPTNATDSIELDSKRYGPHHGPQSTVVKGIGAFSFTGQATALPAAGRHGTMANTCVACHMADLTASLGGHEFGVANDDDINLTSCATCHSTIDEATVADFVTEIETLIDSTRTLLLAKQLIDSTDYANIAGVEPSSSAPITVSTGDAGAIWNFKLVTEDRSAGIHNPDFTRAVLNNTIDYLNQ